MVLSNLSANPKERFLILLWIYLNDDMSLIIAAFFLNTTGTIFKQFSYLLVHISYYSFHARTKIVPNELFHGIYELIYENALTKL